MATQTVSKDPKYRIRCRKEVYIGMYLLEVGKIKFSPPMLVEDGLNSCTCFTEQIHMIMIGLDQLEWNVKLHAVSTIESLR